jgi:type I restriction enzyme S subunit
MTASSTQTSREMKKAGIAELPAEWGFRRLGELGNGVRPIVKAGPFGSSVKKISYVSEGYKIYGQEQVISGNAHFGDYYIDEPTFKRLSSCEVLPGDVLMSLVGTVGEVLVVPADARRGIINPRLVRISVDRRVVLPSFLVHWFKTPIVRRQLGSFAQGGTMGVLNAGLLKRLLVPLPPIAEQEDIIATLDSWDRALAVLEKLRAAQQQRKQALMQQLLTGHKRFPQFKGQKWRTVHLGDVFAERVEINRADLPLVAITSNRGVIPRDELDRDDTSSEDKSKYLRIAPGDIGYNTMRMWQGVSGVSEIEGIVSPAYTICTPQDGIDRYFAGYLFKSRPVIHLFHRHSQGLVKDTLNLKFPNFARIKVTLPPLEEQKKIAGVFRAVDRQLALLDREATALRDQKKGLMQQLLTGKLRVKG